MRVGFIGDVVGKPGRKMLAKYLKQLRKEHGLDCVITNCENASHGFGVTPKNAGELLHSGSDLLTGGNHSWDKKEILEQMDTLPLLRPLNYPDAAPGSGYKMLQIGDKKLAVINLMGHYCMPMCDNPFVKIERFLPGLQKQNPDHIIIDFHAESTAEKQALFYMLRGKVDAVLGTHTHVGTDDLKIDGGSVYISDVGLTGCRDNVLGMESQIAIDRFLQGYGTHFDVPDTCKAIMQMVVFTLEKGCEEAYKLRIYDSGEIQRQEAYRE